MGEPRIPAKVKLITGLILSDTSIFPAVKQALERVFGAVDFESETVDFNATDYYAAEMGPKLKRIFLSFARPAALDGIWKTKLRTNRIEKKFSLNGRRTVNIDPGYVDLSKMVLFSTKDYSHRPYLAKGIFAEVTLYYREGTFRTWPWTYPDYRQDSYIDIFNHIREMHKRGKTA